MNCKGCEVWVPRAARSLISLSLQVLYAGEAATSAASGPANHHSEECPQDGIASIANSGTNSRLPPGEFPAVMHKMRRFPEPRNQCNALQCWQLYILDLSFSTLWPHHIWVAIGLQCT